MKYQVIMRKVKPIRPEEVADKKIDTIPDVVFESFNEMIVENWSGNSSTFTQKAVVARILSKNKETDPDPMTSGKLYNNHWLDVEPEYRKFGWKVFYDKPGYNESYEATFKFSK